MNHSLKKKIYLVLLCSFLVSFSACFKKETPASPSTPLVLVTIPPYANLVKEIAGNSVDVHVLIPPGFNPHIHEGLPSQTAGIEKASLWIRINEPLESQIAHSLLAKNPHLITLDLTKHTPLLTYKQSEGSIPLCRSSHKHGHEEESMDRHIWMSPKLMQIQAELVCDKLIEINPNEKQTYLTRLTELKRQLSDLDLFCKKKLVSLKNKAILISHPSLGYFCHDYHITQIPIECEGKSPLPKEIQALFSIIQKYDIKCALTQPQFDNKATLLIAKQYHLATFEIDPYAENYLENLKHITEILNSCSIKP